MDIQNTQTQNLVLSDNTVAGWPQAIATTNGKVLSVSTVKPIRATLHGVGTILVHPWARGLHNLLSDHARGWAPLDEVVFWMECVDQQSRKVVLEFDHQLAWRIAPSSDALDMEESNNIKSIMRAIYAQAYEG